MLLLPALGKGIPGGDGVPGVPGGFRRGERAWREPRTLGRLGLGWGKTFLLPGDDVKTPELERRMGWEAGRPRWSRSRRVGMGLGCAAGGESAMVGSGAGGGARRWVRQGDPPVLSAGGRGSRSRDRSAGRARESHPHRDAGEGDSTSQRCPQHLRLGWARGGSQPHAGAGRKRRHPALHRGTGGSGTWRAVLWSSKKWESHGEG